MTSKSIIIIGAGMGGMAAGIYGQLNGYRTRIFEMHKVPGGQCASWQRKGYTFDACIHHLMGCSPRTRIYGLWQELGVMPRQLAYTKECVSVLSPEGKLFSRVYGTIVPRFARLMRGCWSSENGSKSSGYNPCPCCFGNSSSHGNRPPC